VFGRAFSLQGGTATDLADVLPKLPLAVDDSSSALIQIVESLGGQRAEQSQFLLVFAILLFKQVESRPHDFAGVLESPRSYLSDEDAEDAEGGAALLQTYVLQKPRLIILALSL
jgi:hypothetical protein